MGVEFSVGSWKQMPGQHLVHRREEWFVTQTCEKKQYSDPMNRMVAWSQGGLKDKLSIVIDGCEVIEK